MAVGVMCLTACAQKKGGEVFPDKDEMLLSVDAFVCRCFMAQEYACNEPIRVHASIVEIQQDGIVSIWWFQRSLRFQFKIFQQLSTSDIDP